MVEVRSNRSLEMQHHFEIDFKSFLKVSVGMITGSGSRTLYGQASLRRFATYISSQVFQYKILYDYDSSSCVVLYGQALTHDYEQHSHYISLKTSPYVHEWFFQTAQ